MNIDLSKETSVVEAVLFLETEPISLNKIASISKLAKDVVSSCLALLKEKYTAKDSGIELAMIAGGYVLCPKKQIWETLKERYGKKNAGKLSNAALITLGIIANNQPVTRAEIESFRGVSCDNMIRLLLERQLIKEAGKKDIPGHPMQYATTDEFLKFFHLASIADLPKFTEKDEQRFSLAR